MKTPRRPSYSAPEPIQIGPYDTLREARKASQRHAERELDSGLVRRAERDHSPRYRPEVRGAEDTFGWDRYGYSDGDGDDKFVVGRAAVSQNRGRR